MTTATVGTSFKHPLFAWAEGATQFYHLTRAISFTTRGKKVDLWCGKVIAKPYLETKATRTPILLRVCPTCRKRWQDAE